MKEQTLEICLAAAQQNIESLIHIRNVEHIIGLEKYLISKTFKFNQTKEKIETHYEIESNKIEEIIELGLECPILLKEPFNNLFMQLRCHPSHKISKESYISMIKKECPLCRYPIVETEYKIKKLKNI